MFYHRAHTDPNLKVAKTSEFHRVALFDEPTAVTSHYDR